MFELNEKEKELVKELKKVRGDSMWAIAIRDVLQEGINWKIRRLIADLKSQRADNIDLMRRIIGQDANDLLARI